MLAITPSYTASVHPEFDTSKPIRGHEHVPGSYESTTCKRSEGRFLIFL